MAPHTRPRASWGILFFISLFILFYIAGWLRPIFDPFITLTHHISGPIYTAGKTIREKTDAFHKKKSNNIDVLKRTIDNLRVENAKLRTLADENRQLQEALNYFSESEDIAVSARVISEISDDALNSLIIDKGSKDGLAIGQPVIVGDGILIGKLSSVTRRTASVLLLSDSKSVVAVRIQNGSGTLGILEGDRGLSMAITLIPQTERIVPGDSIVTSGIEPGIKKGLIIGTVENVSRNTQDPFQSAIVVPLKSAEHPSFVHVLITPPQNDIPIIEIK